MSKFVKSSAADRQIRLIDIARSVRIQELYADYLEKYPHGEFAAEAEVFLLTGVRKGHTGHTSKGRVPARQAPDDPTGVAVSTDLGGLAESWRLTLIRDKGGRESLCAAQDASLIRRWMRKFASKVRVNARSIRLKCIHMLFY